MKVLSVFVIAACLTGCKSDDPVGGAGGMGGSDLPDGGMAGAPPVPSPKAAGLSCIRADQCVSGHCVDGVCCSAACDLPCQACNDALTQRPNGECAALIASVASADECPQRSFCAEGGFCCGEPRVPPPTDCPDACERCDRGTCVVECRDNGSCNGEMVTCPAGAPCRVECDGDGCLDSVIQCPDAHACEVVCRGSGLFNGCDEIQLLCADGPCRLTCETSARDLDVTCGPNSCDVVGCSGLLAFVDVACNDACTCSEQVMAQRTLP